MGRQTPASANANRRRRDLRANADGSNPTDHLLGRAGAPTPAGRRMGRPSCSNESAGRAQRELNLFHVDTRTASASHRRSLHRQSRELVARRATRIYYASDRTGRWEVWKMLAAGGGRTQITRQGGFEADRITRAVNSFTMRKGTQHRTAIWRVPVGGGEEAPVVDGIDRSRTTSQWRTRDSIFSPSAIGQSGRDRVLRVQDRQTDARSSS